jgi:hypothetical protein
MSYEPYHFDFDHLDRYIDHPSAGGWPRPPHPLDMLDRLDQEFRDESQRDEFIEKVRGLLELSRPLPRDWSVRLAKKIKEARRLAKEVGEAERILEAQGPNAYYRYRCPRNGAVQRPAAPEVPPTALAPSLLGSPAATPKEPVASSSEYVAGQDTMARDLETYWPLGT